MIQRLETMLAPSAKIADVIDPIFRGETSLIFIIGGLGHFGAHTEMLARRTSRPGGISSARSAIRPCCCG